MKDSWHGRLPFFLILSAAALGVFLVPWYVPVAEPAMGQSYTYGFNNSVAILAVGLTLVALFAYLLRRWRGPGRERMERAIAESFSLRIDEGGDRKLFSPFLAAAIIFGFLIGGCYWYAPFDHWGEMSYFISRINLLILHRRPYYDFPFAYGPAMLYIPFALYKITHGYLSIEQAYCVVLLLDWTLGLYLLAQCVRFLLPASRQSIVFWVLALTSLNPTLGIQYTPFRYLLPIAGVLFAHRVVVISHPGRLRGHLMVALAAFLGSFLGFELSPDMGMAVTLALLTYFVALLRTPQRAFAHGAAAALLGAVMAVLPWSTAYLGILVGFGGSFSLPVFPGLGILFFLAAVFSVLPRLAVIGVTSRDAAGPVCLALCVLSGMLIVPALSRCDIGHVFFNGLGVFMIALAILAHLSDPRWFKGALAALFLVFAVLGNWVFLFHYGTVFREAIAAHAWMRAHPMPASQPASDGFLFSKPYPPIDGLDPLLAYGKLATPLGCTEDIEHFLLLRGRALIGYNPGNCSDIRMLKQTIRAARDIDTFQTILVPKSYFVPDPSQGDLDAMDYRFLRNTMLFPVRLVQRRPRFIPERVLASHIEKEFRIAGEFRDNWIMKRVPQPATARDALSPP